MRVAHVDVRWPYEKIAAHRPFCRPPSSRISMSASRSRDRRRISDLAVEIKPISLPVRRPALFNSCHLFGRRNSETAQRQEHGSDAHIRLGSGPNVPASPARDNRRMDMPFGPDPMKHGVKLIA